MAKTNLSIVSYRLCTYDSLLYSKHGLFCLSLDTLVTVALTTVWFVCSFLAYGLQRHAGVGLVVRRRTHTRVFICMSRLQYKNLFLLSGVFEKALLGERDRLKLNPFCLLNKER